MRVDAATPPLGGRDFSLLGCRTVRTTVAAFAVLATVLSMLVVASTRSAAATASWRTIAVDNFDRTVRGTLGSAPMGGRYALWFTARSPFSVAKGNGHVSSVAPGRSAIALLGKVVVADTDVTLGFSLPTVARSHVAVYQSVVARHHANGSQYLGRVTVSAGGRATVSILRVTKAATTTLASKRLAGKIVSGRTVRVRLQVLGTAPVRLRAGLGPGGATPSLSVSATDSSRSRIAGAGSLGFWTYLSRSARPTSVVLRDLRASTPITRRPAAPKPPVKPVPVKPVPVKPTPAPTTPAPTTPAPTTPAPTTPAPTTPAPTTPAPTTPAPTSPEPSPEPTTPAPTSPEPSPEPTTPAPTTPAPTPPATAPATRGSAEVGAADYPVPSDALFVSATDGSDSAPGTQQSPLRTVKAAISRAAVGQTIVLRQGIYHESVFVPDAKTGLTIQAFPGEAVWFDGSIPVTSWTKNADGTWTATGWTAEFDHWASFSSGSNAGKFVDPAYPMAAYPDQLYRNGTQLRQVVDASAVVAGTFSVDYTADTITTGSDPYGADMRAADLSTAITVSAAGTTLRGFGVRRYANSLPKGAAVYVARPDFVATDLVIEDVATVGLTLYKSNGRLDHLTVRRAGMLGVLTNQGDGCSLTNSLITQANSEHFNTEPAAGAIKLSRSRHVTIRNNSLSDNYDAAGIWTDESVVDFTIVGNDVRDNGDAPNIEVELSDTGIIAGNTVRGSDRGIFVFDTGNVQIFNNDLAGNSRGSIFLSQDFRRETTPGNNHDPRQPIPDPSCPWLTRNITISNNVLGWNGGQYGFQFYALDTSTNIAASSMNIVLEGNLFHTKSGTTDSMVGWGAGDNRTVTRYESPSDLNRALGKTWNNAQSPTGSTNTFSSASYAGVTVPLPSDVAAALNRPTGERHLGTY